VGLYVCFPCVGGGFRHDPGLPASMDRRSFDRGESNRMFLDRRSLRSFSIRRGTEVRVSLPRDPRFRSAVSTRDVPVVLPLGVPRSTGWVSKGDRGWDRRARIDRTFDRASSLPLLGACAPQHEGSSRARSKDPWPPDPRGKAWRRSTRGSHDVGEEGPDRRWCWKPR